MLSYTTNKSHLISIWHKISVGELKLILSVLSAEGLTHVIIQRTPQNILENIPRTRIYAKNFPFSNHMFPYSSKKTKHGRREIPDLKNTGSHLFQSYLLLITDLLIICPLNSDTPNWQIFTSSGLVLSVCNYHMILILHTDGFYGKLSNVGFNILI